MTTKEWKKIITDEWLRQPAVIDRYGIDTSKTFEEQFSAVSIESLLFYAQAYGMMLLEKIMGDRFADLEARFSRLRPHTLIWYAEKIKAFQLNHTLPADSGEYALIDEASQIVRYCSITERNGILHAKIAAQNDGKPSRIATENLVKVEEYVRRIKDAGVRVLLSSGDADKFSCSLLVHYDPLKSITSADIERVISSYLESMPFDGVYSNMALIDAIQKVDGVKVAEIISSQASYGANPATEIVSTYLPKAGYMALDRDNSNIQLTPYGYDRF